MLATVVEEGGTGRKAAVPGFPVAGKTGTAQKLLPGGRGYSHKDYFSSFVGFLPAHEPKVCIGVFFDAPKPVYYGGSVAGPVFSRIGQAVMAYMGVAPIREKEEQK
jgi:cell division protein FtsI/penicillin-binding protein 2